jgi:DNA-binding FadR family transcriptional regulator
MIEHDNMTTSPEETARAGVPFGERPFRDEARRAGPWQVSQGRLMGNLAYKLGVEILSGNYPPGHTLPNEIDFSNELAISRSVYREAIRILAAKGLVESRPKFGTRVTPRNKWNMLDPEVLGWMFDAEPSESFIKSLFELRVITEPAAAELAAMRRTQAHIDAMHGFLEIMAKETLSSEAGRNADLEFHRTLIAATDNEALVSLGASIEAAVAWTTRYKAKHNALTRDSIPDHRRVLEAIAAGDVGEARWSMESLIRSAHEDMRKAIHP